MLQKISVARLRTHTHTYTHIHTHTHTHTHIHTLTLAHAGVLALADGLKGEVVDAQRAAEKYRGTIANLKEQIKEGELNVL